MIEKFFSEMADIIEVEVSGIDRETILAEHAWDSLAWIETATLLKSRYGLLFTIEDLERCKSVGDIFECIEFKMGK